ncbi:hypothetical protein N7452_004409 [Penicillium brevicompactum]|uniref:C3H1-type domain-containing protein n=1 Tax=Penicillium brevicompactum TaxID=5074 RepID=A0A9W9QGU3_PENBR|nr:hypothetical protein N7452_004409 [Penicillium brevicompactum]
MASQGFSFPPPPPPPPPSQQTPAYPPTQHGQNRGGRGGAQRGRGRGQGQRGRGGHADGGRAPSYPPPAGFNYNQTNYAGYPSQPVHPAPYMPPAPYAHGQSQGYQNHQGPPAFPNAQYPQPPASAGYSHLPYNSPVNQGAQYHQTPSYMQGLPAPHLAPQPTNQAMMGGMPWGNDTQGQYMGAQPGQARGPRPHAHGNYGPKNKNQKRDHTSAFTKPQTIVPRTPAAPAVPSFGNPLPSKPPPAADATSNRKTKKRKKKHNQLGLTPHADDHESSEEDEAEGVDEESNLAHGGSNPQGLQVSYKGKTSSLGTPSEIAAWIAERKKNFPTKARIEAKKKAAEEAKAARDVARQQKSQEQQAKRKDGRKNNETPTSVPSDPGPDAKRREEIRRNLEREQERIAKAVAEADAARLRLEALQKEALSFNTVSEQDGESTADMDIESEVKHESQDMDMDTDIGPAVKTESHEATTGPEQSVPASLVKAEDPARLPGPASNDTTGELELPNQDSDWTSSGGSDLDSEPEPDSDSDSDGAPEQASSRREGPERVPPPPREGKKKLAVCRYFISGQCRKGDQCTFRHETPEGGPKAKPAKKPEKESRRKGLYQALLDQQKDDEDHRAMEVICFMGQNNLLHQIPQ